jgi:translation initiation factor IF-2
VRQSFSHGRTKAVVVEKVKRRAGGAEAKTAEPAPTVEITKPARRTSPKPSSAPATPAPAAPSAPSTKPSGVVLRTLTEEERSARAHALADAKVREAEERRIAEEEARRRHDRESREQTEREAAEARKRDEDERRRHDEETKRKAEQEAKKRFGEEESKTKAPRSMNPRKMKRHARPAAARVRPARSLHRSPRAPERRNAAGG